MQVSLEETDALETRTLTQPRRQVRVPDVSLAVGVVTYLNPGLVFDYDWLVVKLPVVLRHVVIIGCMSKII